MSNYSKKNQSKHARGALGVGQKKKPGQDLKVVDQATPQFFGSVQHYSQGRRDLTQNHFGRSLTPVMVARAYQSAVSLQDIRPLMDLAELMEEKDAHLRSLVSLRKNAINGCKPSVEVGGTSRRAKLAREDALKLLSSAEFKKVRNNLPDAVSKGFSVMEMNWGVKNGQQYPLTFKYRPQKFFQFLMEGDGEELILADESGSQRIDPFKYVIHTPHLKSGHPIRNGLMIPTAGLFMLKLLAMTDWATFLEVFGIPKVVGKFDKHSASEEDIELMKNAVFSMSKNSSAVLDKDMILDILDATGSQTDAFERFLRYIDEQMSRLWVGGILTTGTGGNGSRSLGEVHNEMRLDILNSDLEDLSITIQQQIVDRFIKLNYGDDFDEIPQVRFMPDDAKDLTALAGVIKTLTEVGLPVGTAAVYEMFGLPAPKDGEQVLSMQTASPTPAEQTPALSANNALPRCELHNTAGTPQPRDAIDELADEMEQSDVWATAKARMAQGVIKAKPSNLAELRKVVNDAANDLDIDALKELIAQARVKARGVGEAGGEF